MNKKESNILVISHTSFSTTDSMGSTLASYFRNIEKSNIYQFYIKEMVPNMYDEAHYYRQTDKDALRHCLFPWNKKYQGRIVSADLKSNSSTTKDLNFSGSNLKKRYRNMILRGITWSFSYKFNRKLKKWLKSINITKILLMPGDFSFLLKMANKISKKYKIPVMILQCESYLLKPYFCKNLSYRLYRRDFKNKYYSLMKRVSHSIYLCDELKHDYELIFPTSEHSTLMKSIEIPERVASLKCRDNTFVYAGNLGKLTGRCEILIKVANALAKKNLNLLIYTNSEGDRIEDLKSIKNVSIKPIISKEELSEEYQKHKYILYIENSDPFHVEDLKYAFSTKIVDILCFGCIGVMVGSKKIAGINYLSRNNAAFLIESEADIFEKIGDLTNNSFENQLSIINNAQELLKKNHDAEKNSRLFSRIIHE